MACSRRSLSTADIHFCVTFTPSYQDLVLWLCSTAVEGLQYHHLYMHTLSALPVKILSCSESFPRYIEDILLLMDRNPIHSISIFFNMLRATITIPSCRKLALEVCVSVSNWLDCSVFNLRRLQDRTKIFGRGRLGSLADDAAFVYLLSRWTTGERYSKTDVLILLGHAGMVKGPPLFLIYNIEIKAVDHFTYLGSTVASSCGTTDKIQQRIVLACLAFTRLCLLSHSRSYRRR